MVGSTLITLGTIVSVLVLIDMFLARTYKESLSKVVLRMWFWLDELKRHSLLTWMHKPKVQLALIGFAYICSSAFMGLMRAGNPFVIGCLLFIAVTARPLMNLALRLGWPVQFGLLGLFSVQVTHTEYVLEFASAAIKWIGEDHWWVYIAVLIPVFLLWFYTIFLFITVSPMVICQAATAVVWLVELFVRRIAEYPKGPVLALSAMLGSIAAILKFLE
jgi:hypothetical protein